MAPTIVGSFARRFLPLDRPMPDTEALPPYSYVPGGPWPHPTSSRDGHSFGRTASKVALPTEMQGEKSPRFLRGVTLFNAGYYWEAHEVWEGLWHAYGRRGLEADVIKALIKLAAAGVKVREGHEHGVRVHADRAADLLTSAVSKGVQTCLGLNLLEWAEHVAGSPRSHRTIRHPSIRRSCGCLRFRSRLIGLMPRADRTPWVSQTIASAPKNAASRHRRETEDARDDDAHGALRAPFDEAVAMQPDPENEVHAVPGHDDREKTDNRCGHQSERADPPGKPTVKWDQVHEQRDQGPDLFGVPAPEAAPRVVGPDAAQDRSGRDQEHTDLHGSVDEVGQRLDDPRRALHRPAAGVERDLAVPLFFRLFLGFRVEDQAVKCLAAEREQCPRGKPLRRPAP